MALEEPAWAVGGTTTASLLKSSRRKRGGTLVCSVSRGVSSEKQAARDARAAARRKLVAPSFDRTLADAGLGALEAEHAPSTLQINIGLTCNMACSHCHVESSPARSETMTRVVADRLIQLCSDKNSGIKLVDITGGAPEMHREFRRLVQKFRHLGLPVIDRCNLSILQQPGQEDLAEFLSQQSVQVVASMPCYTPDNVEKQRGDGAFDSSIEGLQKLNAVGYGMPGSGLDLTLVYNPVGATLPPPQASLEEDYRRELRRAFGIEFNSLICITNLPVKRFADDLRRSGRLEEYMQLLVSSFRAENVPSVMCRSMVHVDHAGDIHDCDFNYALGIPVRSAPGSVFDLESWSDMGSRKIATGPHCYGCTAGAGSSCGGTLSAE